jgi:hypothetical protein
MKPSFKTPLIVLQALLHPIRWDPNNLPTIKGMSTFTGIALIDTDVYISNGNGDEWYINQNQFYR